MNLKFEDYAHFRSMWKSGGVYVPPGEDTPAENPISLGQALDSLPTGFHDDRIDDAVNSTDHSVWIPRVINEVIKEAVEPILIGEKLLQKVPFTPGQIINIGALGAISGQFHMGEAEEYPEVSVQLGEGTMIATVGKYGAAIKFTPEILRYSSYPVIDIHTRAVARAMARAKEEEIFGLITNIGQTVFDNVTPTSSEIGSTTGRGLNGLANGSITMDDLFDAMRQVMANGFLPNTMIMHPFTWFMFVKDPILRAFALNNGGGTFFASWSGNPAETHNPWGNFGGQGLGSGAFTHPGGGASGVAATPKMDLPHTQQTSAVLPSYFSGIAPLNIIVTPFMPYDTENDLTDIILCDRNELGYFIVDETLQISDWTDPRNDMYKIKMRERYSLAIANEGQAVGVIRNVKVNPGNQIVPYIQVNMDADGTYGAINQTVSPFDSQS